MRGSNEFEGIDDNVGNPATFADAAARSHTLFRDLAAVLKEWVTRRRAAEAQQGSGQPNPGAAANIYDRVVFPDDAGNYNNIGLNVLGGGNARHQNYDQPGDDLGLAEPGDDNDAVSVQGQEEMLRAANEQSMRESASLEAASDLIGSLHVALGQREPGRDELRNSETTAAAKKAKDCARWVARAVGLVGVAGGLAYLIDLLTNATKTQSPAAPTGRPRVFDHLRIAPDYTSDVTIDVLDNASAGQAPIDKQSLEFIEKIDTNGPVLSDSLDLGNRGKWEKGSTPGQIVFKPGAKAAGLQTSALFQVSDTATPPVVSNAARALVLFDSNDRPDRAPDDDGPRVYPVRSEDNTPGSKVTIDVLAKAEEGLAKIDKSTLTILTGIDSGKTLQVMDEGTWVVVGDTGQISFEPDAQFKGNPRSIRFSVADTNGQRSSTAALTVTYKGVPTGRQMPPVAKAAVVPYTPGQPGVKPAPVTVSLADQVLTGDDAIDWSLTAFVNTRTPIGFGGNPNPAYSDPLKKGSDILGYRTVRIPGQGTWTVKNGGKDIEFALDADVDEAQTSVSYLVGDVKGRVSKPAFITPIPESDALSNAVDALAQKPDMAFWNDLDTLIKSDNPTLEEWASAVFALQKATEKNVGAISAMILDVTGDHQITGTAYINLFQEWAQDNFTVDSLITIAKREVTDATVNLPKTPLATRLLRLSLMSRLYRTYNAEILKATGRGP